MFVKLILPTILEYLFFRSSVCSFNVRTVHKIQSASVFCHRQLTVGNAIFNSHKIRLNTMAQRSFQHRITLMKWETKRNINLRLPIERN